MSHWGKCTGYDYTSERVGFLNQHIATQRRMAAQAAARPFGFTGTRSCQMGTTIGAPFGHSSRPAAARPVATADAAGRPVHEETAFECAAPSLCPQPRPARAVDAGDQRAVSWAAVVLSPGVLPAGRPLPSVAPLEPSIAPTAGHGTTPRSFVSRSSVSGTPGARSTRLDSAREQAPRRCCLPLAAAHASSLGHRRCTSWFFAYSLGVHVVCTSTHIVISGRVLMLMGRGQCELRVGAGRIL